MGTAGRNGRRALALATGIAGILCAAAAPAAFAAPPANDDFADATVVGPGLPVAAPGTNAEATGEPGETSHTGIPANPPPTSSVWYSWTPTQNHSPVIVDLCDNSTTPSSAFLDIAVYTGTAVNALGAPVATGGGFTNGPGACKFTFNATASTTYRIAVNIPKEQAVGTFTLRLRNPSPPANDSYESATTVGPALPVSVPATTIDATIQANEPAALGGANGRSVWFKWTAPSSGQVRADGCDWEPRSGDSNRAIGVYTDTNNALPVSTTQSESNTCQADFTAVAGQEYRIAFSGSVFGEGAFTFRIRSAVAPANDNFGSAIAVGPGLPISVPGQNDFASKQGGEPNHGGGNGGRSVWYTWTPTAAEAGDVAIEVCSDDPTSSFRPDLGVYTGSAVNALSSAGTAPGGVSPYCYKRLNAVAGTTYRIAVASSNDEGDEGPFTLNIHRPDPPDNDDFANAQEIGPGLPIAAPGTLVDATEQDAAGEPTHAGFNNPIHSVWFEWTPAVTEAVTIRACGVTFDSALSVYTGTALGALNLEAQAEEDDQACPSGGVGSVVGFLAEKDETYLIAVDTTRPGYWGPFTLRVTGPSGIPVDPPTTGQPPGTGAPNPVIQPPARNGSKLANALKKCRKKFKGKKRKSCIRKARKRAKA